MGDIKLTARETSRVLAQLEESVERVSDARQEILQAMARRRAKPASAARRPSEPHRKKR